MEQLVPFEVRAGHDDVLIAVTPTTRLAGATVRGIGSATVERLSDRASRSLADAVQRIVPAAQEVLDAVKQVGLDPSEVTVSFGIGLTAGAEAFIASATTNANFSVTLTWKGAAEPGAGPSAGPG